MQTSAAEIIDLAAYREARRRRQMGPSATAQMPVFVAPMFVPMVWMPVWFCAPFGMVGSQHQA
ncbi:hypothetical protein [Terrihabitans sp. B22-R8]|uniref:hypothetical protein n=1 Tax=Terrihabitans sp. B22-R8 TaxID=3425128 RepID=UPI00403C2210